MPDTQNIDLFARFKEEPKVDALLKYAPLYQGINESALASLEEADAFLPILQSELKKTKDVIFKFEPEIRAFFNAGTFAVQGVSKQELAADGFPVNKPIYLHYVLYLNPEEREDNEVARNAPAFNVALAIRQYAHGNIAGVALEIVQSVQQYREWYNSRGE